MRIKQGIFGVLLLLAGCSLVPDYKRPADEAPEAWKNRTPKPTRGATISPDWWKLFGSAELDRLMNEALVNNRDLTAAIQRIDQFRALAKIAGAPLLPAVSAIGRHIYTDSTRSGPGLNTLEGQWSLSYEVDLWGRLRAGRDSARAQLDSSRFSYDALRLTVMGDVAQSYFTLLGLRDRRRIALDNLKNISDVLDIIASRFEAGGATALDVAQQQTERANAAAAVARLDQDIAQAENALAVLLGRPPQQFEPRGQSLQGIQIPGADPAKPAALFEHRPDIQSAEAQLIAAHADIGVARAAFFPKLELNADNIFTAAMMSQPAGIGVALASSLTQPIFQGGRLEGELERTKARRNELVEIYRQMLLTAYREVEDALALGRQAARRREDLLLSVDSARQAYELGRERYLAGATDYQTLLNVQRSLLNAQDTEIQAHTDVLTASVLLYKALGGGWREM
ncbi:efflux transporter outer membrane subunit [Methylomicrobium sp. Wu6]|uniref:efflux transporter outer membrane subunit n=1 Tax=Methylomicrobium sp. Wu6 TaxID=3107928 RepID=UPI002DD664CB|nr:efflux transporter outer membrane subunit [Methylomicrobium sp. Wu6]MEC4747710.1 efflux transporter outer membrane subunit [Methylomicrobium sp. Wu6]